MATCKQPTQEALAARFEHENYEAVRVRMEQQRVRATVSSDGGSADVFFWYRAKPRMQFRLRSEAQLRECTSRVLFIEKHEETFRAARFIDRWIAEHRRPPPFRFATSLLSPGSDAHDAQFVRTCLAYIRAVCGHGEGKGGLGGVWGGTPHGTPQVLFGGDVWARGAMTALDFFAFHVQQRTRVCSRAARVLVLLCPTYAHVRASDLFRHMLREVLGREVLADLGILTDTDIVRKVHARDVWGAVAVAAADNAVPENIALTVGVCADTTVHALQELLHMLLARADSEKAARQWASLAGFLAEHRITTDCYV